MQMGFYFDQRKCVGCWECDFVCRVEHEWNPAVHRRIVLKTEEANPVAYFSMSCMHCETPPCIEACPASAISKRESDGIVVVDKNMCLGKDQCGALCLEVCPYDAPKFGDEPDAKMDKCDFCISIDRLKKGRKPWCVLMCNHDALDYGPMDELIKKYGDSKDALCFEYSEKAKPSIILKTGAHEYIKMRMPKVGEGVR